MNKPMKDPRKERAYVKLSVMLMEKYYDSKTAPDVTDLIHLYKVWPDDGQGRTLCGFRRDFISDEGDPYPMSPRCEVCEAINEEDA